MKYGKHETKHTFMMLGILCVVYGFRCYVYECCEWIYLNELIRIYYCLSFC